MLSQPVSYTHLLFCTGYETVQHRIIDDFIDHIVDSDISDIILADGYKASCEIDVYKRQSYDSAAMSFITQIINYALLVGLILICLNQIGVPTTSFVAAFGAFGLGIGLALSLIHI